ncbi:MAG: DeoR/GlpR family DNA-binding transcription regulator [Candidatus Pseudothioglobus sp.]|jgi:DeoR family glycerol-3-phosphate regulon repressor|tara:strand:- start:1174 stop:1965 length:792 start_codon:yes stop_codon:yes gene_type:complete
MKKLNKRQRDILSLAEDEGYVSVESLAETFSVTQQTIRSDINNFCDQELLTRAHGGAFYSKAHNFAYKSRKSLASDEKKEIADAVAAIIPDNSSIVLGNIYSTKSGTTTELVAESLYLHQGLKVITNDINIVNIFVQFNNAEVWLAGGKVRNLDSAVIGINTADFIKQFKVDYAVVGVSAIDNDGALMDFDYEEVQVSKAIFNHCRKLILVADNFKFDSTAPMLIGNISEVDILVTNIQPPLEIIDLCNSNNIEIVVASNSNS